MTTTTDDTLDHTPAATAEDVRVASARPPAGDVPLFSVTMLLSAALLFSVEPMIGKMLLPRLGGSPAVWNGCLLFFQACLLGGYAYAHLLSTRVPRRWQPPVHLIVLALALLALPMRLPATWQPPTDRSPIPWLLGTLLLTAGPAFFAVATGAPLLQRWFALAEEGRRERDPYFLYAASNAGSFLALLAYPLVIEPWLHLARQSAAWTGGYVVLIVMTALCGVRVWRSRAPGEVANDHPRNAGDGHRAPYAVALTPPAPLPRRLRLRWLVLAIIPSSYLLGITTFITTDIAAVPLLWVAPLAVYLLSFVIAFSPRRRVLTHERVLRWLVPAILAAALLTMARAGQPAALVLGVHLLAFFLAATACHGELARLRPPPAQLTDFYLVLAVGGAVGGAFNSLLAPVIFNRPIEYPLAMVLACLACLPPRPTASDLPALRTLQRALDVILPAVVGSFAWVLVQQVPARSVGVVLLATLAFLAVPVVITWTFARRPVRFALALATLLAPAMLLPPARAQLLAVRRSFFGVHRILRTHDGHLNELFHGTTLHGAQRVDPAGVPADADNPPTYYHPTSPVAGLFKTLPPQRQSRVGVVGLGAGSIAAFIKPGAAGDFFEIDPVVRWAAEESGDFTFLRAARDRGAAIDVIMGDARQQLARQPLGQYDVILMDAFSGDSVPVHLLTREAVAMYLAHLKPGGVLGIHISNLYLDLRPVVAALANDAGCTSVYRDDLDPPAAPTDLRLGSRWVILSRDDRSLDVLRTDPSWRPMPPIRGGLVLWSDDFSNLVSVLRWRRPPE